MQDLIDAREAIARHAGLKPPVFVDCSFYLPTQNKDPRALFSAEHIPGARFFDINEVADSSSGLPHMMPDAATFSAALGQLGISADDQVIIYDQVGFFSAARGWLTFKQFAHRSLYILNGGLPAWKAAGGATSDKAGALVPLEYSAASTGERLTRTADQIEQLLSAGEVVIDARPAGRFTGRDPEPRAGLRGGHMEGALNLPHVELLNDNQTLKSREDLRAVFHKHAIPIATNVEQSDEVGSTKAFYTSCGSGVTAAVVSFALYQLGIEAPVYDGSWAEWGDPQSGKKVVADQ